VAARDDVVRLGFIPEQPLVAAALVCDRSRRRVDSVFLGASESGGRTDDLLATATAGRGRRYRGFCYVVLPWKCRCFFVPGLATERRSCYSGIHEPIPSRHSRAMDNGLYLNDRRSAGEHLAHGSAGRACIAGSYRPALWTDASTKIFWRTEELRDSRCSCCWFDADCAGAGDAFGTTA